MGKQINVTEQVTEYIRTHIRNGEWPIGSKIPSENELCKETGASRTSIRSALQRFIMVGVLVSRHGKGTFVVSNGEGILGNENPGGAIGVDDQITLTEWHQARNMLEPEIAYRVAEIATDEFIERLKKNCEEQRALIGKQDQFIAKDIEFHMMLAEFLGNRIITDMLWQLLNRPEIHKKNNNEFGYYGGVHFHLLIADAISQHDAKRARNMMLEHGREADFRFYKDDIFAKKVEL